MSLRILAELFIITSFVFSQQYEFKNVNSAEDVIDNYLLAIGGKNKLKKIRIVKIDGTYSRMGEDFSLTRYVGTDFYYQKWGNDEYSVVTVYDGKNNSGWEQSGESIIDFPEPALDRYHSHGTNYWGTYLESKKLGISFNLLWIEPFGERKTYAVEIIKDGKTMKNLYFDIESFYLLRTTVNENEMVYSDYKEIGNSRITLPHLFASSDTLRIDKYEIDPLFDRNLLKKPAK